MLDELQGNLRVVAIELDVRKQLVRPRRVLRVLGRFQDRERSACVARGLGRMVLQRVEPRMGPVESRAQNGVARVRRRFESSREELLCGVEVVRVDVRVRQEDGEARRFDLVLAVLGGGQRLAEDGDRRFELVDHRVGAAEGVRGARLVGKPLSD